MSDNRVRSFKTPEAQENIEKMRAMLEREELRGGMMMQLVAVEIGLSETSTLNYLRHMGRKEIAHMRPNRKWFPGPTPKGVEAITNRAWSAGEHGADPMGLGAGFFKKGTP